MRKPSTVQRISMPLRVAARLIPAVAARLNPAVAVRLTPVVAIVMAGSALPLVAQDFNARAGSSVTLGGRVQAQFEASGSDESKSSFFIRRAWITVDGRLNELVSGRLQFDANGNKVLEAYLAFTPSDRFRLELGQFKRAISTFWLAANFDLPLIERDGRVPGADPCPGVGNVCSFGRLTGGLGLDAYEPGFLMSGRLSDKVGFRVTMTNGEGINGRDKNSAKSTSGRLTFDVGSNSHLHTYAVFDETVDTHGHTRWAPAYALEYELGTWRQGPLLVANVATGRNWKAEDASADDHERAGFVAFQAMGLWYLPIEGDGAFEAFEPLFRVSWASTQTGPSLGDGDMIVNNDVTGLVITPGFMLYATGRTGISTNLDIYSSSRTTAGGGSASMSFDPQWSLKVQAFVAF